MSKWWILGILGAFLAATAHGKRFKREWPAEGLSPFSGWDDGGALDPFETHYPNMSPYGYSLADSSESYGHFWGNGYDNNEEDSFVKQRGRRQDYQEDYRRDSNGYGSDSRYDERDPSPTSRGDTEPVQPPPEPGYTNDDAYRETADGFGQFGGQTFDWGFAENYNDRIGNTLEKDIKNERQEWGREVLGASEQMGGQFESYGSNRQTPELERYESKTYGSTRPRREGWDEYSDWWGVDGGPPTMPEPYGDIDRFTNDPSEEPFGTVEMFAEPIAEYSQINSKPFERRTFQQLPGRSSINSGRALPAFGGEEGGYVQKTDSFFRDDQYPQDWTTTRKPQMLGRTAGPNFNSNSNKQMNEYASFANKGLPPPGAKRLDDIFDDVNDVTPKPDTPLQPEIIHLDEKILQRPTTTTKSPFSMTPDGRVRALTREDLRRGRKFGRLGRAFPIRSPFNATAQDIIRRRRDSRPYYPRSQAYGSGFPGRFRSQRAEAGQALQSFGLGPRRSSLQNLTPVRFAPGQNRRAVPRRMRPGYRGFHRAVGRFIPNRFTSRFQSSS